MRELLKSGSEELGIPLSKEQVNSFSLFYGELEKWGRRINLTALLDDERRLVEELFLDSLAPLVIIREEGRGGDTLLDIGSGGGFPGIPIKIAEPNLKVTLTDSVEKKVLFQRNAIRALSLTDIEASHTRFDDSGSKDVGRESFDWALSKAVADIETLGIWAWPHLKKGGRLTCMKGGAEEAVSIDGYNTPRIHPYTLPLSGIKRRLIIYEKV